MLNAMKIKHPQLRGISRFPPFLFWHSTAFFAHFEKDQASNVLRQLIVEREDPKHFRTRFTLRHPVMDLEEALKEKEEREKNGEDDEDFTKGRKKKKKKKKGWFGSKKDKKKKKKRDVLSPPPPLSPPCALLLDIGSIE